MPIFTLHPLSLDVDMDEHRETVEIEAKSANEAYLTLAHQLREQGKTLLYVDHKSADLMDTLIPENDEPGNTDFALKPQVGAGCWITVGSASVFIKNNAEGVSVDIYRKNGEDDEPDASCFSFFADLITDNSDAA